MMNWYDKAKAIAESLMKQKGTEQEKLHRAAMEGMKQPPLPKKFVVY